MDNEKIKDCIRNILNESGTFEELRDKYLIIRKELDSHFDLLAYRLTNKEKDTNE